jgi:hypothetical protein
MGETAPQAASGTNRLAITGFVAALAAFAALAVLLAQTVFGQHVGSDQVRAAAVTAFWVVTPIGAILGIVLGHMARRQTKQTAQAGAGLALASLVIGYVCAVGFIVLAVLAVLVIQAFTHMGQA